MRAAEVRADLVRGVRLDAPNLARLASEERDARAADLEYRDCLEWAVGHGVATRAVEAEGRP